jgi:excinuclease ABC subunit C
VDDSFDSKRFLKTLTHRPGVYEMLDETDTVLYVGKAKDLKNRVSSYFGSKAHHPKTQALMAAAKDVRITVTHTELEALLLEFNLIKLHQPRFNVLLRDDKSYPYIRRTGNHEYPRLVFHRGARKKTDQYFGPFPNSGAVRQTLALAQKLFRVRQCEDSFFANRSRPCLQYQIKRCSGPCTGMINKEDYASSVHHAELFLNGRSDDVVTDLMAQMEQASTTQAYEEASRIRDQIAAIKQVQAQQAVAGKLKTDADALAVVEQGGVFCIVSIMIRHGRVLGSRRFFPRAQHAATDSEVMRAFISQHYFDREVPGEILVNVTTDDAELLAESLSVQADHKVRIRSRVRSPRRDWVEMAATNARDALQIRLSSNASVRKQREELGLALGLDEPPTRMECFDISHTSGAETVASCVVFGLEGPIKSAYRRFNIKNITPGDDYAAIAQVVKRRYRRVKKGEVVTPDLALIDGGKGQLSAARGALAELEMDHFEVVGVSKGPDRRPGEEQLWVGDGKTPMRLQPSSAALHLIQQMRDEAHRFAIGGHRQQRSKARKNSVLEDIRGLGPKRRRELLRHFGGLQGVARAGVEDLSGVPGISTGLAREIYGYFHDGKKVGSSS